MVSAGSSPHIGNMTAGEKNAVRRLNPESNGQAATTTGDVHSMDFDLSEFSIQSSLDDLGLFSATGDSSLNSDNLGHGDVPSHHTNQVAADHTSRQPPKAATFSSTPIAGSSPAESSRGQHTKSSTDSPAPHRRQRHHTQSSLHPMSSPASASPSAQHPFNKSLARSAGEEPSTKAPLSSSPSSASSSAQADQSGSVAAAQALQQFMNALEQQNQARPQNNSNPQPQQSNHQQHPPQGSAVTTPVGETQAAQHQLSLQEIQRLIAEKEQSDRLQSLQTALLRQQLEIVSRAQHNPQVIQQLPQNQQRDLLSSQSSVQQLLSLLQTNQGSQLVNSFPQQPQQQQQDGQAALSPDAHQLLTSLLAGSNPQQQQQPQPHNGTHPNQMQMPGAGSGMDATNTFSKLLSDSSFLAQYGLITPPASGAFNVGSAMPGQPNAGRPHSASTSHQQPPFMSPLDMPQGSQPPNMNGGMSQFSPRDSPAITPASVFSNMSLGGMSTSTEQFFSPLTSPALHPQPPYYGNHMAHGGSKHKVKSTTTPSASPLALTGKPGPLPRKNRSTTAEARANRSRPSPLIKPSTGSVKRKKDNGTTSTSGAHGAAGSTSSSRRPSISESGHSRSGSLHREQQSQQGSNYSMFTPVMAGAAKPMDASPSEGAVSTPSPIDLSNPITQGNNAGKPMTPSSLMGIPPPASGSGDGSNQPKRQSRLRASSSAQDANATSKSSSASSSSSSNDASNANGTKIGRGKGAQVTFAAGANVGEEDEDEEGADGNGGAGGSDSRRTSHKAAEQKRRDSLKYCFDELRGMLPPITLDEEAPGGSYLGPDGLTEDEEAEGFDRADVMDPEYSRTANRAISKVALLRHSNEWIIRLRNRLARRDAALGAARSEVEQLRTMLLAHGIMPPGSAYGVQQQAPQPPPGMQAQHFVTQPQGHHPHFDQHVSHQHMMASNQLSHDASGAGGGGGDGVGGGHMDWN